MDTRRFIIRWRVGVVLGLVLVAIGLVALRLKSDATQAPQNILGARAAGLEGRVEGRVLDGSRGIPNSSICAAGTEPANRPARICASSDEHGEFSIVLASGTYVVTASASGYVSDSRDATVRSDKSAALEFTLRSAQTTLAGSITDGTGKILSNVLVQVFRDAVLISSAKSDENGKFGAWAPVGEATLAFSAAGFQDARISTVAPTTDLEIALYSGFSVKGKVVIARSHEGAGRLRVSATADAAGTVGYLDRSVMTDDGGLFKFDALPPGQITFSVDGNGLTGRSVVNVSQESSNQELVVLVHEGQTLAGRLVTAPNDAPCTDGWVQLIPEELLDRGDATLDAAFFAPETTGEFSKAVPLTVMADKNGAIEIPAVVPGYYAAFANCPEFQMASGPTHFQVAAQQIAPQTWRFEPGTSIVVDVVDEAGREIKEASLTLQPEMRRSLSIAEVRANPLAYATRAGKTDAHGRYRFGRMKPGRYSLSARDNPLVSASSVTQAIEIVEGAEDVRTTLTLPISGSIEISARTPKGSSVSRLMFYAADTAGKRFEGVFTGDGRYLIKHLPRGAYRVVAYDNKNPKQNVPAPNGDTVRVDGSQPVHLDFEYVQPEGIITGVVRDATGAPAIAAVQAVSATLDEQDEQHANTHSSRTEEYRTTDEQGRFQLVGVALNVTYRLFVQSRTGQRAERTNVTAGEFVQVSLPALASLSGKVTSIAGADVPEFFVTAENNTLHIQESASFKNGAFKFDNLNPGNLDLFAFTRDGKLEGRQHVELRSGQTLNNVQIELSEPVEAE